MHCSFPCSTVFCVSWGPHDVLWLPPTISCFYTACYASHCRTSTFCLLQDYLAANEPLLYASMSYSCIEISPTLAQLQQQTVVHEAGHSHGVFTSIVSDAASPAAWDQAADAAAKRAAGTTGLSSSSSSSHAARRRDIQQHCFVLMMEVLDNLPHDRCATQ